MHCFNYHTSSISYCLCSIISAQISQNNWYSVSSLDKIHSISIFQHTEWIWWVCTILIQCMKISLNSELHLDSLEIMLMKLSIYFYRKNTTTVWRLEWGPPLGGFDPRPCQSWHQLSWQQGPQHHECVCCRGATRECCWKGWQNSSWRWTAGGTDFHNMRNKCSVRFILCIIFRFDVWSG